MPLILSIDPGFINLGYVIAEVNDEENTIEVQETGIKEVIPNVTRNPEDYYYAVRNMYKDIVDKLTIGGFAYNHCDHPFIEQIIIENVYTPWLSNNNTANSDYVFRLGLLVTALYCVGMEFVKAPIVLVNPRVVKAKLKIKDKKEAVKHAHFLFTPKALASKLVINHHIADALNQLYYQVQLSHPEKTYKLF